MNIKNSLKKVINITFPSIRNLDSLKIESKLFILLFFYSKLLFQVLILPLEQLLQSSTIDFIKLIKPYFYYADSHNILTYNTVLRISLTVLVFNIVIIVNFLQIKKKQQYKSIKIIERLLITIMIIFSKCFIALNCYLIKLIIINNQFYFIILPFINIFLIYGICFICETFLFSYSFKNLIGLNRNCCLLFPIKFVLISVLVIIGSSVGYFQTFKTLGISFCFLFLSINELNFYLQNIIYYSKFTSLVYLSTILMSASLSVMILAQYIFPVFRQNFFICLGFVWLFSFVALRRLTLHTQNQIIFLNPLEIKNENIGIKYLRTLHHLISNYMNGQQSMILASFIANHVRQCLNISCKCKSITEGTKQLYTNQQFLKGYVQNITQEVKNNVDRPLLTLMTICYNVQVVKSYTRFFTQIQNKFNQNNLQLNYGLYCLKQTLRDKIQSQNRLELSVPIQMLIQLEETIEQLKKNILHLIKHIRMRWNKVKRQICFLNQVEQNLIEACRLIIQNHKIWMKLDEKHCFNPQICSIFLFYFKNVLFFDCEVRKVKKLMDRLKVKHMLQQKIDLSNIEQFMFSPYNCVVVSIINPNKMGIVKNITKNCKNMFNLPKSKIINNSIGCLMTSTMAKQHERILMRWIETGRRQFLNKIKDTFCATAQQILFQSFIYVRLLCTPNELKFVVNILKGNDQDYLLLNQRLEVEAYGKTYKNIFSAPKKGLCIKNMWPQLYDTITKTSKIQRQKAALTFKSNYHQLQKDSSQFIDPQGNPQKKLNCKEKNKLFQMEIQFYSISMGELLFYVVKMISYHEYIEQSYFKTSTHIDQQNNNSKTQFKLYNKILSSQQSQLSQSQIFQYQGSHTSEVENVTQSNKLVQRTLNSIYDPKKIKIPRKINIIIIAIVISCFIISGYQLQSYIYGLGFSSVSNVIFADGAVSDNMQILQILYNKIIIVHQYNTSITQSKKLESLVQTTAHISGQLYNLITLHLKYLQKNYTLSEVSFYEYLQYPVHLKLKHTQAQIQTLQFMEYYYYSVLKTITAINNNQNTEPQMLKLLMDNWETMKFINHYNIRFYQNLSKIQLSNLKTYLSIISMLIFLFLIPLGFLLYKYLTKNLQIKQALLRTNQYVSTNDSQKIYQYFYDIQSDANRIQSFQLSKQFKNYQITYQKKKQKTNFYYVTEQKKYFMFILGIILFFASLQAISLSKMFNLFDPCQKMILYINQLMDSQNYLLESYFQLKSKFILGYPSIPQNYQLLKDYVSKPQSQFNLIVKQSSKIFQQYDPSYFEQYSKVLLTDICQLIIQYNPQDQINKCKNNTNFGLLSQGILSSMNFFHRQTHNAYITLEKNLSNPTQFFSKPEYQDIDQYTFFMFRIYQLTQSKMFNGLNQAINQQVKLTYKIGYLMISIISLLMICWIVSYKFMKIQLSKIYGYGLFYPPSIINQNKIILTILQKNLVNQI